MRVLLSNCPVCAKKGSSQEELAERDDFVEVTTEVVQRVSCPRVHTFVIALMQPRHVLLYERALYRIAKESVRDGYLDGYTALETYLAHVAPRARYAREAGASPSKLWEELKPVVKLAEPARGAALAIASLLSGGAPPTLSSRLTQTRNEAIHAGDYPAPEAASKYMIEVGDLIRTLDQILARAASVNSESYWERLFSERRAAGAAALHIQSEEALELAVNCVLDAEWTSATPLERIEQYRSGFFPTVVA